MEYRLLGRTGVHVSPLCLGTMMFGDRTGLEDSCRIIDHAIDQGVNFLDTANIYSLGESERVVGEALQRNGHRDFVVLASKCHGNMHLEDRGQPPTSALHARLNPNRWGNSRRQIIEQCEASLGRLQTDYLDLFQIHRPQPDCAIDETLRALDDLVRSGKVRYTGTSTYAAWQLVESLWASEKLGLNRFATEQPPYHLLDRRIERELLPMCRTYGLGVVPWSPLAGGFLTGKYRRPGTDGAGQEGGRFSDGTHARSKNLENPRLFEAVDRLTGVAQAKGRPLSQLALAWCRDQPGVASPIIGPRTMEQLNDNLAAMDLTLTAEDHQQIDAIVPPGEHVLPFYEANFGPHPHRV